MIRFLILLLILCFLVITVLIVLSNYFYNFAINTHSKKTIYTQQKGKSPEPTLSSTELAWQEIKKNDTSWLLSTATDIYITRDSLRLQAYKIDAESNNYAIVVHGYRDNAPYMSNYARHFYDMGMNVLVPNLRGHGKSEGNYIGMGWHDHFDLLEWVNVIRNENQNAQIVLFGISMGAATVMMTSGETLPANVVCVVEDCGYTSVFDQFAKQLKEGFGLPPFPIIHMTSLLTHIRAGYHFNEASALNQIKKSVTPTLFIHGDSDKFVPFSMLNSLYEAARCEKEKLVVSGAGHAKSSTIDPDTYWGTIERFTRKYLA